VSYGLIHFGGCNVFPTTRTAPRLARWEKQRSHRPHRLRSSGSVASS